MIRFYKKWYNPLYFILNDLLKDESIRTILVYGGKSSAKTLSISQILSKESAVKGASSITFRKESATIKDTLKESINLAIQTTRLNPAFEKLDFAFRSKINDSIIRMKGIDDEEKAKGVEGFKYVYMDELNHFLEGEYLQFQMSLRGIKGQKIFASWNPVEENSWVKVNLVDKYDWIKTKYKLPCEHSFVKRSSCGRAILIKTTYEDNYWISGSPCGTYGYRDDNLINEYTQLRLLNYNKYKINVLGEWGKTSYGGEILKCWKSEQHTGDFPYNPELAVYLSFDENVNPYFPCGFFQIENDQKTVRMIHCIAAKHPNNTVKWICAEITRVLKHWGHNQNLYIGGDPTSQKEDVKQEKGHDLFRLIMGELIEFKPERRLLGSAPSVKDSFEFFNNILQFNDGGIDLKVNSSCRIAINDFEYTKEDKNGKVDKALVRDPITKVSYQPYGHFVDLTRYFLCSAFADEYEKYRRGGKKVPITFGKRPSSRHGY